MPAPLVADTKNVPRLISTSSTRDVLGVDPGAPEKFVAQAPIPTVPVQLNVLPSIAIRSHMRNPRIPPAAVQMRR
jgi:hypothetical protein